MKFIELFAGIGGFRLGLEQAGHQCVWANEFVPKAASIYEHNFKHKPDGRDIRRIHVDEIPSADLLVGGFPCATFSVAGRRTGFGTEDTRGTLFFEICRILSGKRIPYVFLENVKGLLNHDDGRTFGVIVASLDELGYDVQWECLNSKNFGVPQNRERIFIVGNLRGKPRPKVFPIGRSYAENSFQYGSEQDQAQGVRSEGNLTVGTLCHRLYKGDTNNFYLAGKVRTEAGVNTQSAGLGTPSAGLGDPADGLVRSVLTPAKKTKRQRGRQMKEHNEPAFTLTASDRHGLMVGSQLRRLTPLECERLQSLPDNWTKWYADGSEVPDSQRYERCGRAVTVNVIYEIAKRFPI
jgi:DNA (cytosine-5)-methyltransferase 1